MCQLIMLGKSMESHCNNRAKNYAKINTPTSFEEKLVGVLFNYIYTLHSIMVI